MELNKEIKSIAILKPIICYDNIQKVNYECKDGCIIVEYYDNTRNTIDLENMLDITNNERYEYKLYKKTKIKWLFKSEV